MARGKLLAFGVACLLSYFLNFYVLFSSYAKPSGFRPAFEYLSGITSLVEPTPEREIPCASPRPGINRFLHVLNNRSRVEGAVLGRINMPDGKKEFDPARWRRTGCEGKTYEYTAGSCAWCPRFGGLCSKGTFSMILFRDDHFGYSLKTRGTLELVGDFRPEWDDFKRASGKAEVNTFYLTCDSMKPQLPVNQEGILSISGLPDIRLGVNAFVPPSKLVSLKTYVCTKAFYGTMISEHTVVQFVTHYLENWLVDVIFMYELGTSFGELLSDLLRRNKVLSNYVLKGRIVLIDFRPELQRTYGAFYASMVLFSSKNGQLLVASDCVNRVKRLAKRQTWVLPLDWDEILSFGSRGVPGNAPWRFNQLVHLQTQHALKRVKKVRLWTLNLKRKLAAEHSICKQCIKWNMWQGVANQGKEEPSQKYAVIVESDKYPKTWAYGVHVMSRCAFPTTNKYWQETANVSAEEVYIRHYKCLNAPSEACSSVPRTPPNWAFVDQWNEL